MKKIKDGRPPQYSETKKPFTITITPTAIDNLKALAEGMGLSRSEMIEQIARNKITLLPTIDARLKVYLKPQPQVFLTISEFTRRCWMQIGTLKKYNPNEPNFSPIDIFDKRNKEVEKLRNINQEENDEISFEVYQQQVADSISRLIFKAVTILYVVDRAYPDLYPSQMILPIKFIIFYLITSWELEENNTHYDSNESETNDVVLKDISIEVKEKNYALSYKKFSQKSCMRILTALAHLKIQSPGYYEILKMSFKSGLSIPQIAHIKSINHNIMTSFEVRIQLNEAINALRRYVHVPCQNDQTIEETEYIRKDFQPSEFNIEEEVCAYYNLCLYGQMRSQEHRKAMRYILKTAYKNRMLKFWLWEIDHWTGHQMTSPNKVKDTIKQSSKIADGVHVLVQERLKELLDTKIKQITKEVDRKIGETRNKHQIVKCLEEIFAEETGINSERKLTLTDVKQYFNTSLG